MIKLNLGCGNDYRQDFINVDSCLNVNPDIVANLDVLPFGDNYADYIVAQDILEQFSYIELQKVLSEIYRVLKPYGTLEIKCLDAEMIIDKYKSDEFDIDKVLLYLFGSIDNVHKIGLTKKSLRNLLESFNFRLTTIENIDFSSNMRCICIK